MVMLDLAEALALAHQVAEVSSADETEVTVDSQVEGFVRFADVGPTQCGDRSRLAVAIRARFREGGGFREARSVAVSAESADWRRALERALELARISPVNEEALPLEGPVDVPVTAGDPETLAHGFEPKAEWVRAALAACADNDLRPAGLARTMGTTRAVASSVGRAVCGQYSRAHLSLTATGNDGSGVAMASAPAVALLGAEETVERAVTKAVRAQGPSAIEPGEYTVVLEPAAVSAILLFASYYGFGAREVDESSSFLCDRIGEKVFADGVTIRDDVFEPTSPGLPFDGEGNPKQRVILVEGGIPRGPVTDRTYARKLGLPCTGHAMPQPSVEGPRAGNLVVAPGTSSLDELIAGVDRGLLVSQFHYTNMIEPRDLTLTGMTRNGTFLIDNGEVKGPVKNLRFTDKLVRALAAVTGVGDRPEAAGALFEGEVITPPVRVDGFRFTSCSDF